MGKKIRIAFANETPSMVDLDTIVDEWDISLDNVTGNFCTCKVIKEEGEKPTYLSMDYKNYTLIVDEKLKKESKDV